MLLKTFGGLSLVTADGVAAGALAQRRRLCLLAVLAEAGERGATREKLLGLLWPEADEERGRAALAQALYALRQGLGSEEAIEGAAALRLNDSLLPSDVTQFRRAVAEGRFQAAAELYQGPFLDGVYLPESPAFERWVEELRTELAGAAAAALESAAVQAAAAKDHAAAVSLWRRRAALDPYQARGALGLMRALEASGDRAAAVRYARTFETLVREQLGVAPDGAVTRLADEMRHTQEHPVTQGSGSGAQGAGSAPVGARADAVAAAAPARSQGSRRQRTVTAIVVGAAVLAAALAIGGYQALQSRRPTPPAVPGAVVLAVGDFNAHGPGADELARTVTDLLNTSLARSPGVTVVSTARLRELVGRQSGTPNDSAQRLLRAARLGGATAIVEGALYTLPAGIRLDLRRTDLATGRVALALTIQAPDLFAAVDSGTRSLLVPLGAAPSGSIADVTTNSLPAFQLYSAGLRQYHAGRRPAAYQLFREAVAEDSLFAMAEFMSWASAMDHEEQGRHLARALRLADRASERERLLIRWEWAAANDEPASEALAESLVTRFAAEPFVYVLYAVTMHAQGRFLDAVPVARRGLALDQSTPMPVTPGRCIECELRGIIVGSYRLADSVSAAEREARAWVRERPASPHAWVMLGEQLFSQGDVEAALAARARASALGEPASAEWLRAWSGVFAMDYQRLDTFFVGRLRTGDLQQRQEAAWWLTTSYRAQGRLRDALETARIIRNANTNFGQRGAAPYEALQYAQSLAEMGRAREAAAVFDSIARLRAPGITNARWARHRAWTLTHAANSLALAGDTAGLLTRADTIEAAGRRSHYARDQRLHHHVRGLVYAARGAHQEAAESFRRAIYSPVIGYTRTNQALARELVALGRPREAIPWLRAALRGGSEGSNLYLPYSDLHEGLALAFSAAGERDSARVHAAIAERAWQQADPEFAARRAMMASLAR